MKIPFRLQAFSLVELLVVVAIVGIMATLAVPALINVAQGQGMKRAINSTSDLLEIARAESMAKSTWTWVGLMDSTQNNDTKRPELTLAAVISRDGTTNTTSGNLTPLIQPIKIADVSVLPNATPWGTNSVVVKNSSYQFSTTINGVSRTFSGTVVAFSPQGEALITTGSLSPWLEIGLQEMRGTQAITNKTASIRISGISGQIVVDY